jgi:amino acid transporter
MKPATMAAQLGSPLLLLVVWVVAGIISIFGGMMCRIIFQVKQKLFFLH